MIRCAWAAREPLRSYHDREWGVPEHEDRRLFEFLILEGAQAGLSWETILNKRQGYRRAFAGFVPAAVAAFDDARVEQLVRDPGIVRHRGKIQAAVDNARSFLAIQSEFGSFDRYVWRFTGGSALRNAWRSLDELPASSEQSEALSRDLRARGFRFVGPTICYSFMQAIGMVNDHLVGCYRYAEL